MIQDRGGVGKLVPEPLGRPSLASLVGEFRTYLSAQLQTPSLQGVTVSTLALHNDLFRQFFHPWLQWLIGVQLYTKGHKKHEKASSRNHRYTEKNQKSPLEQ